MEIERYVFKTENEDDTASNYEDAQKMYIELTKNNEANVMVFLQRLSVISTRVEAADNFFKVDRA